VGLAVDELSAPAVNGLPTEAQYVASHPAVVAKQRDIEVSRREVEVARLNRNPNWTWEVSYGQRQGRADLVSFNVNIPLTVAPADRQDRESAAKLALVDKVEADLAEAERAATGEYAALSSDARRLQERIERFRTGVIVPAEQRTAATTAAYRSNQASLVMVFEARHAEVELRRKLLTLQRDLAKAQAQLVLKPISQRGTP
jgi:outer membrane protein TolC